MVVAHGVVDESTEFATLNLLRQSNQIFVLDDRSKYSVFYLHSYISSVTQMGLYVD